MKKILRFVAWIFVAVVFLVTAALIGISIWAGTGQRDLSNYNDFIEQSINESLNGKKIQLGKTYLEWNHLDDLLTIKAEKIELFDEQGAPVADLPRIILKYNVFSLIKGSFMPSKLYLIAPQVDLTNLTHKGDDQGLDFQDFSLGGLDEVRIVNGALTVPGGTIWTINRASLSYETHITMDAVVTRDKQQILASLRTNKDQSDSHMRMQFRNLDSDNLLYFLPELAGKRFIANGEATYSSDSKGKFINFNVIEMVGEIDDPNVFTERLVIKAGNAEGTYDMDKEIVDIKKFQAVFEDDLTLTGNAIITTFNTFVADVAFSNVQVMNFKKYWPIVAAPNAIAWIKEHMTDGLVKAGTLKLKLTPEEIQTGVLAPDAIDIKFEYENVGSSYLPNLPPITNGKGTGVMNGTSVKLNIESADAGKSKITRAVVDFYDFDKEDVYLSVDADIVGDASDTAAFYTELGNGKKLLGSKDNVSGQAKGNIKVKLPLLAALKVSEVDYHAKVAITDGAVKTLFGAIDAQKATVNIEATPNAYSVVGQSYATYTEPGEFTLANAPISFEVASKGSNLRIAVASDITNSTAEFAMLELKKEAGQRGKLLVEIVDNGQVPKLNKVMLDSDIIRVNAKGTLKKDYSNFASLDAAAQFGKTDLVAKVSNNNVLSIDIKAPYLDAGPIIRHLKKDDDGEEDDTAFKLRLKADEVGLLNGQSLKNAYVTLSCAKDCDTISLNSQKVMFNQTNATLTAKVANAGSILKGFDIYDNMVGGELEINAKVQGENYDGRIIITDFSIVKAQILARMLTLGSLTGIADILRGKGISFKKLAADFQYTEQYISVKDFRMVGSAIGITANGKIDNKTDVADISGNIIPAYTANTLLGKIPLLGDVIIGSDGVFALAYSLKGNMDNPDLSVNPLSVLAPGFLKGIFQ